MLGLSVGFFLKASSFKLTALFFLNRLFDDLDKFEETLRRYRVSETV